MKSRYITTQILLACQTKRVIVKKDIHAELQETINERLKIMERLQNVSRRAKVIDLYLATTKAA